MALRKLFPPTILVFACSTGYSWQDKAHTEKMLVNSSSGLCPLPGFAHSWAHKRAQPYLGDPTAQGVPSIQAPTWPLEQGHRCGRIPGRSPPHGPTEVREDSGRTFHILERGGPTWQGGFLPPPCFQKSILFSKARKKGPKEPYFVNWPFARFRSPPGMFPNVFPRSPLPRQPKHDTNKQK